MSANEIHKEAMMKKLLTTMLVLLLIPTIATALTVGDIDFDKLNYSDPLIAENKGFFLIRFYSYPNPAITIVRITGIKNTMGEFSVLDVAYLKNNLLYIWKYDGEQAKYKQIAIFPDQTEVNQIIVELRIAEKMLEDTS